MPSWERPINSIVVDLGSLQTTRVIYIYDLCLCVEIVDLPAPLPVTITCHLDPTEGEVRLCPDRWRIDIGDTIVELGHSPEGDPVVTRIETTREIGRASCRGSVERPVGEAGVEGGTQGRGSR